MTFKPPLSMAELERLQEFSTPTLANAIEVFDVRPRNVGFMSPEIRCLQPVPKPMIGYACTGRFRSAAPAAPGKAVPRPDHWAWLATMPEPRVVVLQDMDDPPGVGSFWGEVMVTIHKALGCVGTVTNGGVRDLDEVRKLGFHYFAAQPVVSHAYVHLLEFGQPVEVGGLQVRSGDLIHADAHGVLLIPAEVAPYLAEVAEAYEACEQEFLHQVRAPGLTLERLKADWQAFNARRSALRPPADFRR